VNGPDHVHICGRSQPPIVFPRPAGTRVSPGINRDVHSFTGRFTNGPYGRQRVRVGEATVGVRQADGGRAWEPAPYAGHPGTTGTPYTGPPSSRQSGEWCPRTSTPGGHRGLRLRQVACAGWYGDRGRPASGWRAGMAARALQQTTHHRPRRAQRSAPTRGRTCHATATERATLYSVRGARTRAGIDLTIGK